MSSVRHDVTPIFPYGPNSRLIRALLYPHTNKTSKSESFPLLLWTEVQPVHTPVGTQVYMDWLSANQILAFYPYFLVYNNASYKIIIFSLHERLNILNFFLWTCPLITLSLHLRSRVMTKGREIIIFAKSKPPFDVHRQYLYVSLTDSQARVSRFRCRTFHCFVDFSKI